MRIPGRFALLLLSAGFAAAADPIPAVGVVPPGSWSRQPAQPARPAVCERSYCKPDFPNEEEYQSRAYAAKNLQEALRAEQDRHRAMTEYLRQLHDENAKHYNEKANECSQLPQPAHHECLSQAMVEKKRQFEAIRQQEYRENEIHRKNWEQIHEVWQGKAHWNPVAAADTHRQAQQNREAQQTRPPQPARTAQPVQPRRQAQQTRQQPTRPTPVRQPAQPPRQQPSRSRQG